MSKRNNFYGSKSGLTARTIAFLAATGITDATISAALNTMDLALIANGLDTKMQALYPFVGGTASTHKWNFMNALDTDAAFRLTFAGGWTHSATGGQAGNNGYADTHVNANTQLSNTLGGFSIYSRSQTTPNLGGNGYDMGCDSSGIMVGVPLFLVARYTNNFAYSGWGGNGYTCNIASMDARQLWTGIYQSGVNNLYKNATSLATAAQAPVTLPSFNVYLGAANANGTAGFYAGHEYAMAAIHTLSTSDMTNWNSIITALQTALSRNV